MTQPITDREYEFIHFWHWKGTSSYGFSLYSGKGLARRWNSWRKDGNHLLKSLISKGILEDNECHGLIKGLNYEDSVKAKMEEIASRQSGMDFDESRRWWDETLEKEYAEWLKRKGK